MKPSRLLVVAAALAVILVGAWYWRDAAFARPAFWTDAVAGNPAGAPVVFAGAYALAVVLFLPTLPLNLVAGVLWGPVGGSAVAIAGSASGAIASFYVARTALTAAGLEPSWRGRASWLEARFVEHGWKIVAFVRLNPIFPGPVNFLFGLTSIPARTYCWATAVFLIPPTAAFAVLGSAAGSAALEGRSQDLRRVLLLAGASVLLLVVSAVVLRRYTARSESID